MDTKRFTDVTRSFFVTLILAGVACNKASHDGVIPQPAETKSLSINLYDDYSGKVICQFVVKDIETIRTIYDCLTPCERSKVAAGLMLSGPVIGKLDFRGPRGTVRLEFVDAGMNPLCFRVEGISYIRGGATYRGYRSDHKRLYNIDSSSVDEGMMFFRKLKEICQK